MKTDPRIHEIANVSSADIDHMLAWHGLGAADSFEILRGGLINTNVMARVEGREYLVRIYTKGRTSKEIEFEISVLNHLEAVGFPAQRIVQPLSGSIGMLKGHHFLVLDFVQGETLSAPIEDINLVRAVGALVGELRQALTGFVPSGKRERADLAFLQMIVPKALALIATNSNQALFTALSNSWKEVAARMSEDGPPRIVVHADIAPENIVFRNGEPVALIDFDDAYFGSGLVDVATPVMDFAAGNNQKLDPRIIANFLHAYRAIDPSVSVSEVVEHMWLNSFRYMTYTAELTLNSGEPIESNTYAKRLLTNFVDGGVRAALISGIEAELALLA